MKLYLLFATIEDGYYDYIEIYHEQRKQVFLGAFSTEEKARENKAKKKNDQRYYNLDIYEIEVNEATEI